jgi:hypothetical protein
VTAAFEPRRWRAELQAELKELAPRFEEDFGFPLDEEANFVGSAPPAGPPGPLPPALAHFYSQITQVWLSDVGNGWFIHPADWIPLAAERGLATRTPALGPVLTFGSDGGGGQFTVALATGRIYHLPPAGLVDGTYFGEPVPIAPDFEAFLEWLLITIRRFVTSGDPGLS